MKKGILYLIPTPLGDGITESLSPMAVNIARELSIWIVENEKTARRFLKSISTPFPMPSLTLMELNEHSSVTNVADYFTELEAGLDVGLMSEAGCPGVADPGAWVVTEAHQRGIRVVPMPGPSSILLALMGSGMNGQSFSFVGYLPVKPPERLREIKRLEGLAMRQNQAQIFIETPYRNASLWKDLLAQLLPTTRVCVAIGITTSVEKILTKTVAEWKKMESPFTEKLPTVFVIG